MRPATLALFVISGLASANCGQAPPAPPGGPDAPEAAEPVREPGVLEGRITYEGPERDRVLIVGRDPGACGPLGSELKEGSLLLGEGSGLANAVLRIEGIHRSEPAEPADRRLDNVNCLFEPRVLVASVGDRLVVGSRDPALHSTRVRLDGRSLFNLTLPSPGSQIAKPLREPGLLQVGCDAHAWMRAWVFVGEGPDQTLSDADGEFRLEGLPPGEHVLIVWHERLGEKRVPVSIPPRGRERIDVAF